MFADVSRAMIDGGLRLMRRVGFDQIRCRSIARLSLLVAAVPLTGCTYLHNSGRMELAEQAQAEFAEIVKNPPYSAETARSGVPIL